LIEFWLKGKENHMRAHLGNFYRILGIGILAAGLITSVAAFAPTASATPRMSQSQHSQVQPYCVGSVTGNPSTQTDHVGDTVYVSVKWYCEGGVHVVANIGWGDNTSDNYTCWANCGSGTTLFQHVYTQEKTYKPSIFMNGSASGSTSVVVIIS
jgi:hypothetical protein